MAASTVLPRVSYDQHPSPADSSKRAACYLRRLGLLEEPVGVAAEQLLLGLRVKALPGEDVVDRVGELTLRVRVIRGVHQHVVTEEVGDIVEHVLAFVVLDAAEKPAARHVFARLLLEGRGTADIDRLLVHAPGPERQPAKPAFEHAHPQARILIKEPAGDKRPDKAQGTTGVTRKTGEEDVSP